MDGLARLGGSIVALLAQGAGIAMGVVIAWKFLLLILSGGNERALGSLLRTLLIFGVAIAVVTHIPETVDVVTVIGAALYGMVASALRGAAV